VNQTLSLLLKKLKNNLEKKTLCVKISRSVKGDIIELEKFGKIFYPRDRFLIHIHSLSYSLDSRWSNTSNIGPIIGLIIALGLLVLLVGGLNTFLASLLWFPVKSSFWSIVIHGIVLSIALVITDAIFVLAPSLAFPGIATRIVTFVVSSFVARAH
jgi:hypothetical protein